MADNFEIVKHNLVGYINPDDCAYDRFKPWIQFLNEHSLIRTAITLDAPLKVRPLRVMCTTAVVSQDLRSFSFALNDSWFEVNETTLRTVLNLPMDNFVASPSNTELLNFFTGIRYNGRIDLSNLRRKNLVQEWDAFFDTLSKVFTNSKKGILFC